MQRKPAVLAFLACLGLVIALPGDAMAQSEQSALSGVVTDSTGAVLVGATVSFSSTRGAERTTTTDARGRYRFERVAPGTYTLVVHQEGFGVATNTVEVGQAPATHDVTLHPATFSEEVTVSFTSPQSRTALKMDAPVRDIPLTVKSYTNSFVKALDVKTVNEMFTYMNGINNTGNGVFDASIRGFTANQESNNFQMNGMPGFAARQTAPSIANVERVDVLKGPASVLYGRATPGGLINIVTKKPQAERSNLVDLRFGTFAGGRGPDLGDENSFRVGADLTGPLGTSGKVLYRLVGAYEDSGSFRDFVDTQDLIVAPSLTFNLSEGTILTLEGEYRNIDKRFDNFLIAPENDINFVAPINTRYQEPDDEELDKGTALAAFFTKVFHGGSALNVTWRSVFHEDTRDAFENNRVESDNRSVRRRDRLQINNREYHFLDANFATTAETGSVSHHFLFGAGGGFENRDFERIRFGPVGFFIDLFNPVYGQFERPPVPTPGTHRLFELWDYSLYAQDRIDLSEKWKGLLSLRYDRLDTDLTFLFPDTTPGSSRTDDAFVPTAGLVFQPNPQWSLYGSFATSFEPQNVAAVDENGDSPFDPEKGKQFEGGFKATLADGRADLTLAAFHIERENVLVPIGGGASEQVGKERSQGFEVDLRLQPAQNFQTILGYTYADAKVVEDLREDRVGAQLPNSAKHAFNIWARYDVTSGAAEGLGFGLGVIYRAYRPGSFPSQVVRGDPIPGEPIAAAVLDLPAYTRIDAGIYYVKPRWELTLRMFNLADELYYVSAFNLIQVRPGSPREVSLSLRFRL